jgi:hypothetical protein
VKLSASVLEDDKIAVIVAAISDTSAKLIEGLIEGHLFPLVNGRFVECEPTHSGSVQALRVYPQYCSALHQI